MGIISLVTHPYPQEIYQARLDRAIVTNQELVERPYWYKNEATSQLYFDVYAAIGWPSEVIDSKDGLPGYIAIVGVVRPDTKLDTDPRNAKFQIIEEYESANVPTLLDNCLLLRDKYGYGIRKDFLNIWIGDPDRFLTTLALFNERITDGQKDDKDAVMVSPPDDFYVSNIFDNYIRDIESVVVKDNRRLYFGYNEILQNKFREGFTDKDPAIWAIGGLIHTLLCRCTWMDSCTETAFTIDEERV